MQEANEMKISNFREFRREIAKMSESVDAAQYRYDFEDLIDNVSEDLMYEAQAKGFKYGDDMPEFTDKEFWEAFKNYDKE